MDYSKHYGSLVEKAKSRPRPLEYCEKHHITPKSHGGTLAKANLVYLTYKEHCVAHRLLYKLYPQDKGLVLAAHQMASGRGVSCTKLREVAAQIASERMTGRTVSESTKVKLSKANLGKTNSKEARSKISAALRINNPMKRPEIRAKMSGENHPMFGKTPWSKGKKLPKEIGLKISISKTGKKASEETKQKLSNAQKNLETVVCPHCGKSGKSNGMTRYHFENCKKKG